MEESDLALAAEFIGDAGDKPDVKFSLDTAARLSFQT